MHRILPLLWVVIVTFFGCQRGDVYTVEGTVIEVMEDGRLMVEHETIDGFMDAMTMPFSVSDPEVIRGVKSGDRIVAQLVVGDGKARLTSLRVTLTTSVVYDPTVQGQVAPIRPGEPFPSVQIGLSDASRMTLGVGQTTPVALTFIYTTCPMPEFCPAIVARLRTLQPLLEGTEARIVAVTLDPETDTLEVLNDYGLINKANPKRWSFARTDADTLKTLITLAGMRMSRIEGQVVHSKRLLVLSKEGTLLERYDDANWPIERVARQLKEGEPQATSGASGTLTPNAKK